MKTLRSNTSKSKSSDYVPKFRDLEEITFKEATEIAALDRPLVPFDNGDGYIKSNSLSIYLITNIWVGLIKDYSDRTAFYLKQHLLDAGLLACIKEADGIANAIIHDDELIDIPGISIWCDYLAHSSLDSDLEWKRTVLEALRFPKRYSPAKQEDVLKDGLKNFLELNRSRKYEDRVKYLGEVRAWVISSGYKDSYLVEQIYDVVRQILMGTPFDPEFWGFHYEYGYQPTEEEINQCTQKVLNWANQSLDLDECEYTRFTNGATAEASGKDKTFLTKLRALSGYYGYYRSIQYPWSKLYQVLDWDSLYDPGWLELVPKSYKTPRVIVKETILRNFIATGIRIFTTRLLEHRQKHHNCDVNLPSGYVSKDVWKHINVEDQDKNREIAWEASISGKHATYDFSSASDSIRRELGVEVFPIFKYLPWLRDAFIFLNQKKMAKRKDELFHRVSKDHENVRECFIFLTSGHPLTFFCEDVLIFAATEVANDIARRFFFDKRYKIAETWVFGDDMEGDARLTELYLDIFTHIGMTIGVEKSFDIQSNYRESCGVEYFNGYSMTGPKWPRTTFDWARKQDIPEMVTSLVELQHKTFDKVCWKANALLSEVIKDLEPKMTYSEPYTMSTDLWTTDPGRIIKCFAPMGICYDPKWSSAKEAYEKDPIFRNKWDNMQLIRSNPSLAPSYMLREIHAVPGTKANYKYREDLYNDPQLELALYVDFLRNGPRYPDKLSRLLRVSEPVNRWNLISVPRQVWVRIPN